MKKFVFILLTSFLVQIDICLSQDQVLGNWISSLDFGIERHDKRLFFYSEKATLLRNQPESWGTYHFGFNVKRKIWSSSKLSGFLGLGMRFENSTFRRPFDQLHFGDTREFLLVYDRYEKILTPLSLNGMFRLGNYWFISGEVTSNLLIFRSIKNFDYTEGLVEIEDFQLRFGVNRKVGKILFGLNSRLVNFQKIDEIIFNRIIKDPRNDQVWEWDNPLRFDFTIGYVW